jgi:hypothetical protein
VKGCGHTNSHGVQCGLKDGHTDPHEPFEQLVEPGPFCIRATDPLALSAIRSWIIAASKQGVPEAKLLRAEETFNEFRRWQKRNGTRLPR